MRFGILLGLGCALTLHGGFVLFGGLLFPGMKRDDPTKMQQVELLSAADEAEKKPDKKIEPPPEEKKKEEIEQQEEKAPDAAEIIRSIELSTESQPPALEAASLSAIADALNGSGGGGGDLAEALSLASGGRIGMHGKANVLDKTMERAFSLDEIDQKPRVVYQASPIYPAEMRGKKVEGYVTLIFLVDANGKVVNPKVEKSSASAFDRPALDAIKRWKFDAAVKGGQRVGCRMRETIRFQPN
jgi:periplasmic protein TonB